MNVFWLGLQINRHELSKLRKVFKEYCHNTLRNVKFQSIVEIDKTLFGRQVKFHKGYPNRWLKITFLKSICLTCTYFSCIYFLLYNSMLYYMYNLCTLICTCTCTSIWIQYHFWNLTGPTNDNIPSVYKTSKLLAPILSSPPTRLCY